MNRTFIIGDIHGCCKTFRHMVTKEINIRKTDKLYLLGDYIDRGPDSKGVIDFILELRAENYQVHTLRGNHEELLLRSGDGPNSFDLWFSNGGDTTLDSFGIESIEELDPVYLDFFKRTKYYIKTKELMLVHAGLNFREPDPMKDKMSMLWIRRSEADLDFLQGRLLVHGHTPTHYEDLLAQKIQSPLNIDGGCVFKNREGYGYLIALDFTERKLIEVRNKEG